MRQEPARSVLAGPLLAAVASVPASAEQVWKVQTSMSAGESFYTNTEQS